MPQIINESSLGGTLGNALGSGISTGLQSAANIKLNQMLQRLEAGKTANALQSLGYDQQKASQLSNLPEPILREVFRQQQQQQRYSQEADFLRNLLGGQAEQPQQQLAQQLGQEQQLQQPGLPQSNILPQTQQLTPQENVPLTLANLSKVSALKPGQALQIANYLQKQAAHKENVGLKKEALELKKQELSKKDVKEAFKETKKLREGIIEKAKVARQSLHDLDRMQELEKEGKLDTPGYVEFLERSGFSIPALMNPGSEEYNKIAATFQRGAKEIFGSRISNYEVQQFLKTIPSLSQSPEGRKRVIANLKYIYNGNLAYNDALREVVKENKGVPPLDLNEQIDEKISKKLDKLSEKFKEDLAKPVPAGQNKAVTALQAAAGSALGAIPGALKGAAKGAVIGATVGLGGGPIGVGTGALLGSLGGLTGLI